MNDIALAFIMTATALIITTALHYEVLTFISQKAAKKAANRRSLPAMVIIIISAHLIEIGIYSVIYYISDIIFDLGAFNIGETPSAFEYYYFAAETYSSLGYGDIFPTGAMRLIAAIEPLNGILLLTWSGAFLFMLVQKSAQE